MGDTDGYNLRHRAASNGSSCENTSKSKMKDNTGANNDEKMGLHDLIRSVKDDLTKEMKTVTSKIDSALAELKQKDELIKGLEFRCKKLEDELEVSRNATKCMAEEMKRLSTRVTHLDTYSRRSNLIFYGIMQNDGENCETKLREFVKNTLKLHGAYEMDIERCHRLGGRKPQPMICRFTRFKDREAVWAAKSHLKSTKFTMKEDFPQETIQKRKILFPIMINARKQNKFAELREDKLVIDRKVYTIENLNELPEGLNANRIATKRIGDITAFFTSASPLSNFYECDFVHDGLPYKTLEHFLQREKAIFAEKPTEAEKIRNAASPAIAKRLGDSIVVKEEEWLAHAKDALRRAAKQKFTQDQYLKQYLLETEDTILAEASKNNIWGVGLTLSDKNLGNTKDWTGKNLLGNILMDVRRDLQNNH